MRYTLADFRQWRGETVRFSDQTAEGRSMIARGFLQGVIVNVTPTKSEGVYLFEMAFGPAGNRTYGHFSLESFIPPNGVPSAKTSATQE